MLPHELNTSPDLAADAPVTEAAWLQFAQTTLVSAVAAAEFKANDATAPVMVLHRHDVMDIGRQAFEAGFRAGRSKG